MHTYLKETYKINLKSTHLGFPVVQIVQGTEPGTQVQAHVPQLKSAASLQQ